LKITPAVPAMAIPIAVARASTPARSNQTLVPIAALAPSSAAISSITG
jgi:hypothetical protein